MAVASNITVASKLPFGFVAEFGGKSVTFAGAKAIDGLGEAYLTEGFGLTPGVDAAWFEGWKESVGDFAPLKNGAIFATAENKAADEAKEMATIVKTGLEQKTPDELGVEVSAKEK